MSDDQVSSVNDSVSEQGIPSKIISFCTSRKGMYIIAAIVLVGVAYYYFNSTKKSIKDFESIEENTEIPQAPPGYVTVPVDMLQQQQMYGNIPQNNNVNFQTQQQLLQPQNQEQNQVQEQTQVVTRRTDFT